MRTATGRSQPRAPARLKSPPARHFWTVDRRPHATLLPTMANEDVKQYIDSAHDFYELLGVQPTSGEKELRSAWRKTALKYHPDKVGANQEALDKFHLLQIAYDVLSDATTKELYDNARRAREEKALRQEAFGARRKTMIDELERRESGALKRKRDELDEQEKFERELARLAADGKRRREARAKELRREAEAEMKKEEEEQRQHNTPVAATNGQVEEMDRSVRLRFPKNEETEHLDRDSVQELLSRFGKIEYTILRDKKVKLPGEKHRATYYTVLVVFVSIVGAHAMVSDFDKVKKEDKRFAVFEDVNWASGTEPQCVPKAAPRGPSPEQATTQSNPSASATPETPRAKFNASLNGEPGLRKVPSFGSFKATPTSKQTNGFASATNSPSMDEFTMMRLKNAEKRRLEEKIRREEAEAAGEK